MHSVRSLPAPADSEPNVAPLHELGFGGFVYADLYDRGKLGELYDEFDR